VIRPRPNSAALPVAVTPEASWTTAKADNLTSVFMPAPAALVSIAAAAKNVAPVRFGPTLAWDCDSPDNGAVPAMPARDANLTKVLVNSATALGGKRPAAAVILARANIAAAPAAVTTALTCVTAEADSRTACEVVPRDLMAAAPRADIPAIPESVGAIFACVAALAARRMPANMSGNELVADDARANNAALPVATALPVDIAWLRPAMLPMPPTPVPDRNAIFATANSAKAWKA